MDLHCRGRQNRCLFRQTLDLKSGYGNLTLSSGECSAVWNGFILSPAKRSLKVDEKSEYSLATPHFNLDDINDTVVQVAQTFQYPSIWIFGRHTILTISITCCIVLFGICVMGRIGPLFLINMATRFSLRDLLTVRRTKYTPEQSLAVSMRQIEDWDHFPHLIPNTPTSTRDNWMIVP